jgi:putative SOS response-associated peptidase YedK
MCGRFTLTTAAEVVAGTVGLSDKPELTPRFNIAPSQRVLVVRARDRATREGVSLKWGLVPPWAKDPSIGNRLINARGETVAEKPSFRDAFRRRRCLVIADGFYEWRASASKGTAKQPFWIHAADERPIAFAGLWESWQRAGAEVLETCAIITTSANSLMEPIHARMPVILNSADHQRWLDPLRTGGPAIGELVSLLKPSPSEELQARAVDTYVNSPAHDGPACIAPAT